MISDLSNTFVLAKQLGGNVANKITSTFEELYVNLPKPSRITYYEDRTSEEEILKILEKTSEWNPKMSTLPISQARSKDIFKKESVRKYAKMSTEDLALGVGQCNRAHECRLKNRAADEMFDGVDTQTIITRMLSMSYALYRRKEYKNLMAHFECLMPIIHVLPGRIARGTVLYSKWASYRYYHARRACTDLSEEEKDRLREVLVVEAELTYHAEPCPNCLPFLGRAYNRMRIIEEPTQFITWTPEMLKKDI